MIELAPETTAALQILLKEYQKIEERYKKKVEKEKETVDEKLSGIAMNREELAEAYGYGSISRAVYDKALIKLENMENGEAEANDVTSSSEVLRMVRLDISEIQHELKEVPHA